MNDRMYDARLAMSAIVNESGTDKGLQRLGSRTELMELQQLASAAVRALAKASRLRADWAAAGIHR